MWHAARHILVSLLFFLPELTPLHGGAPAGARVHLDASSQALTGHQGSEGSRDMAPNMAPCQGVHCSCQGSQGPLSEGERVRGGLGLVVVQRFIPLGPVVLSAGFPDDLERPPRPSFQL